MDMDGKITGTLFLIGKPDGTLEIGVFTPVGFFPLIPFNDLDELRRFSLGILGWCGYYKTQIPSVFLDAFKSEGE